MKHHISPPKGLLCPLAEQELLQVQPLPAVGKDLKFSNFELRMSCVSVMLVKRFCWQSVTQREEIPLPRSYNLVIPAFMQTVYPKCDIEHFYFVIVLKWVGLQWY